MTEERIFAGIYPSGILYSDRRRVQNGDYKRLGFLSFSTLSLDLEKDCPEDLADWIREDARRLQARVGEPFRISTAGQEVILGSELIQAADAFSAPDPGTP